MTIFRFPRQGLNHIFAVYGHRSWFFFHTRQGHREYWDYALLRLRFPEQFCLADRSFPVEVYSSITGVFIENTAFYCSPLYPMYEYVAPDRVGPGLCPGPRQMGGGSAARKMPKPDPRFT